MLHSQFEWMWLKQVGSSNWRFMSRKRGTTWETDRVPVGALQFRMVVTSGYDGKWIWAPKVLPEEWTAGVIYDTGVQINDVSKLTCSPCDDDSWS